MLRHFDALITRFVQNWIADPLQFSGVKLEWQVRGACALYFVGFVIMAGFDALLKKWWNLSLDAVVVPISLLAVVYGLGSSTKLALAKSLWGLVWVAMIFTACLGMAIGTDYRDYCNGLVAGGLALRSYLLKCKPKPPVGSHKVVFEGA